MGNVTIIGAGQYILRKKHINITPRELVSVITQTCKKYANKRNAQFNKKLGIAKNYGVTRPELRKITKNVINMVNFNPRDIKELVLRLWKINNNEEKTISMMLIAELMKSNPKEGVVFSLKELKTMINFINTWDMADFFGIEILGRYLAGESRNFNEVKKWSKDKNVWIRRIYGVSAWGYYSHSSSNNGKRKTEKALSIFNNVITDSSRPVKMGVEWALRNICKSDWKNCFGYYKFWTKIKDPTVAWTIKKSSIFMPVKFRKKILSKIKI